MEGRGTTPLILTLGTKWKAEVQLHSSLPLALNGGQRYNSTKWRAEVQFHSSLPLALNGGQRYNSTHPYPWH